jgi:hypothetical protein
MNTAKSMFKARVAQLRLRAGPAALHACRSPCHCRFTGEEPLAAARSRDIELAGLQSRLTASNAELQRLNCERDSLVATMAVVDDVHARALQQARGEAEAASQVRSVNAGWGRRGVHGQQHVYTESVGFYCLLCSVCAV